ncbi:MAG: polyamine ABC transporter ATP-binding protein [Candidatus Rokuibacteriota bacterium]|nr:MAG: polyamine ABC transporter ATP-binding protein [Candidatus Rokubacteria bacterium]
MSAITLSGLTKRFGNVVAVDDLHLDVQDGELMALLGPSGCGKTTTLRAIAGFELPDSGDIDFGDHRVTNLPPERRNIGMVFQNYALFPHMTVAQNVAFGLEMRKEPALAIRARVATTLAKVQLTGLEGRYPRQLSGGQQQRAALARALVVVPDVLLLDEPLANLDAKLREEMRFYVRSLQQEVGITTIYVTHDQAEAMVIADRIAVMFNGRIHQLAAPQEIYHRPHSWMVAEFVGLTNFIEGKVVGQGDQLLVVDTALGTLRCGGLAPGRDAKPERLIAVRPEAIQLSGRSGGGASGAGGDMPGPRGADPTLNRLRGVVRARAFLGNLVDYRVEVASGVVLRVQGDPHAPFAVGDPVDAAFQPHSTWSVPAREERVC